MKSDWRQGPQATAGKVCTYTLSEKLRNGHFCLLFLCWALVYRHGLWVCGRGLVSVTNICFFDCCRPVEILNGSPAGHQSQVLWGSVPWKASATSGVQTCIQAPSREILAVYSGLQGDSKGDGCGSPCPHGVLQLAPWTCAKLEV